MSKRFPKKPLEWLAVLVFHYLLTASLFAGTPMAETPSPSAGIEGVVSMGPTHGGPTKQGESDSAPLANAVFEVTSNARTVTTFTTDGSGHFRIPLAPGRYSIKPQGAKTKIGGCGPFEVEVIAGSFNKVHWECDSGLR